MTARYRRINMEQEPLDIGLDDNGRVRVVFNIQATKTPSKVFEEEIAVILELAGIAPDVIFASTAHTAPDGDDAVISIVATGGASPEEIHNEIGAYPRPTAKLTARGKKYKEVRALAYNAYDALKVIRNEVITAT